MSYRVAFFPTVEQLAGNPYWSLLRSGLEGRDVELHVDPQQEFSIGWLRRQRGLVDVLHFHFVQQFYAYETHHVRLSWVGRFARNLLIARALGYRTVFTLHDLHPTWPLRPRWADYLGHWCAANLTSSVIVHCEQARAALRKIYGRQRGVYVTPHPHFDGVYPSDMSQETARHRLGLAAEQLVLAFVGGIRPNKGVDHLVRAFQQFPDQRLRLLIAGRTWPPETYFQELQALAAQDDRITLSPDADLQVYLGAADVIVLPFSQILTSSSVMLAMSHGKAVVVPRMGCLPELVTPEAGVLYDPDDPMGLSDALKKCTSLDLPALQAMGRAARARVLQDTPDKMAMLTVRAYRRAAASVRGVGQASWSSGLQ